MKKNLTLAVILWLGTVLLAWCQKNVDETVIDEEVIETSNNAQSLDLWELISLTENNFPRAYFLSQFNTTDNLIWEEKYHVYTIEELWFLTPEYSNMVDREVTGSGIEDDMIYTTVKATLDDGKQIDVLYIVDPVTNNFVAASIEDGDIISNYQFSYSVESLTYEDLEDIAGSYKFPESNTYSIFNMETQEATTWEVVYLDDTPHNLTNLTPDFPAIKEYKLNNSGIEDGMVYTHFDVVFEDDTTGNILYINNPESLRFVAATVESEGNTVNYQYN